MPAATRKPPKLIAFDVADYLKEPGAAVEYLNQAFASGEPDLINAALGDVARAAGMSKVAGKTGVNRQNLYKALAAGGNPTVDTLVKVMSALGLKLSAEAA